MLSDTIASLQSLTPPDLKQLSKQKKIEIVQKLRESNSRNPNLMLFLATDILASGSRSLGNIEKYEIYEAVLIAALECGKLETANMYLNLLEKKFGRKSLRVSHLKGLCLEAEGRIDEAKKWYVGLLIDVPTDDFPVRRLSAMHKSVGDFTAAIAVLEDKLCYKDEDEVEHRYLDVHRGDGSVVYRELSILHYNNNNISKAIYYAEECLLFQEESHIPYNALGELYYTNKNYQQAVVVFSQSLRINQAANNTRAAYGLWQSVYEILRLHRNGVARLEESELNEMEEMIICASDILKKMYAGSSTLFVLESFLQYETGSEQEE